MKNYIFWVAIGIVISMSIGCTEKKSTVDTVNYVVVNNTDDSVRLEYRSTILNTSRYVDSTIKIVRLLRGERKTIYQRNPSNIAVYDIYGQMLSDYYGGILYGLKGSKPDTIRAKNPYHSSLGYPYYWTTEAVNDNTVNRVLTLY